ncbi:hypothetical protein CYFUS_003858 [Cystobacter fuscus]|uniref:DUF72 domain-containing protein n=1 Tax=Cystobacter fuscus TaxID=43 RepID=A0A250J4A8_9BACT|nr:DUF72 domain-containing protein [Cystobacter fuscus]ATB38423.1 hypothetical protein CYFUS_003858 [Cystobacter fuscus]
MNRMIRIGPAGWSYDDWAGIVYPKPRPRGFDPLAFLAGYFDALELNTSFYRPISRRNAALWLERTAFNPDFRFTAKLWRRFTHERGSAWTADEVRNTREGLDTLHEAGRLGAVLVQFPWSFRNTADNRDWLDEVVSTFPEWPLVLEVRHASWNEPDVFVELAERGVGFVNIDQPLFRHSLGPSARATSPVGYVRVHGRNFHNWFRKTASAMERYDYLYPARELEPWAERTKEIAAHPRVSDVYVVTNNHVRGKGIVNALMLQTMLTGRQVHAPETLVREYPDTLGPYVLPPETPEAPAPA